MKRTQPSIVLCHGIWADGSCFNNIIPLLQADGYETLAVQYGLDTHAADVAQVKRALGRVSSPSILVGHSYGGAVITSAGTDDRIAGLVYISAVAPDANETVNGQLRSFTPTEVFKHVEVAEGRVWLLPDGTRFFAGDLPEPEQQVVWAVHYPPDAALFDNHMLGTAWKSKPSWFVIAKQDQTVHPDLQRFASKRMRAKVREVDSSHVTMLSNPSIVVDVIRQAAEAAISAEAAIAN
jgi:pimeloyl-ACP methyl ester carboxylesterase